MREVSTSNQLLLQQGKWVPRDLILIVAELAQIRLGLLLLRLLRLKMFPASAQLVRVGEVKLNRFFFFNCWLNEKVRHNLS